MTWQAVADSGSFTETGNNADSSDSNTRKEQEDKTDETYMLKAVVLQH